MHVCESLDSSLRWNDMIWDISGRNYEEYDPATDTWEKKADAPTTRYAHSIVTVNGRIYAIGGTVV